MLADISGKAFNTVVGWLPQNELGYLFQYIRENFGFVDEK
jgi:hypothetical protein